METKICLECGKEKSLDKFYRKPNGKYGFSNSCKDCINQKQKIYNNENREKINKNQRNYNKYYREEILERQREYYEDHKEELREKQKEYNKTPNGKMNNIIGQHKRKSTKLHLKVKDNDYFWRMTPEREQRIIKRQYEICPICNLPLNGEYSRDHIIPLHDEWGDPNQWCLGLIRGNVQIVHKKCNSKKRNKWNIIRAINEILI